MCHDILQKYSAFSAAPTAAAAAITATATTTLVAAFAIVNDESMWYHVIVVAVVVYVFISTIYLARFFSSCTVNLYNANEKNERNKDTKHKKEIFINIHFVYKMIFRFDCI